MILFWTFVLSLSFANPGEAFIDTLRNSYDRIFNILHPSLFYPQEDIPNDLPVPEMVKQYGYTVETHKVTTSDGYINSLHRLITHQKNATLRPIFVQHGLFGTSADFIMGRPDKSIGYILADLGYDVWLGNCRGNKYSREHTNLSVHDTEYWKFSFDEMGRYDIPAAILHIKNVSNSDKIYYLGHSMGTVMFWIALEENPSLNREIKLMMAMGPVAKVTHVRSPIRYLAPFSKDLKLLFHFLGINEIQPTNSLLNFFDKWICDLTTIQKEICENILFLMAGYDYKQMNMTLLPIILGHEPGGTSTRTLIHFAQEINDDRFQKFDHGREENLKLYNQTTPPAYNIRDNVQVPIALLWSENDWLADPLDVQWLQDELKTVLVQSYRVPYKQFNHIDFLWGLNANAMVYEFIKTLLKNHA
eukprot:TRINITY_DN8382_c0_g1_i1.p1 TRINITY_DN8382_c0_g1~~TRINITY_DN8382_c0_g1_i1.p1  ORF type:complete len:417 (-),score=34.87 TRINITY_DN8382_c0_g1_i1:29-1279(-)